MVHKKWIFLSLKRLDVVSVRNSYLLIKRLENKRLTHKEKGRNVIEQQLSLVLALLLYRFSTDDLFCESVTCVEQSR